jgi:pseudaminic acid synthase
MRIGKAEISNKAEPYVIAEMSANHENSIDSVMDLMRESNKRGISAFKLQTYTADSLTIDSNRAEYIVKDGPWAGRTLYDLYKQGTTPIRWLDEIFDEAKKLQLEVFSTPFGLKEVELLENYKVNAYKVASFEITYTQLLKEIGATKKPVILSTGMASKTEIGEAIDVLTKSGSSEIALLKCTTSYPAKLNQLNLSQIQQMYADFNVPIGFSDHTESELTGGLAVANGAVLLEKHVKLDRDKSSLDSTFALPVSKLGIYISHARDASIAKGNVVYGPEKDEAQYLRYRRSLIAKEDIEQGVRLDINNIAISRPNIGLAPKFLTEVVGCKSKRKIYKGEGISWENISN